MNVLRRMTVRTKRFMQSVTSRGGWFRIREPFTGAWQRNQELDPETVLRFSAVFACLKIISGDISKMRIKSVRFVDGVWIEDANARRPVLRKPNHYQSRNQFITAWVISRLVHGNTYVLLRRDSRGAVDAMYVLDPDRVTPLVTEHGDVYYRVGVDYLSEVRMDDLIVPASEVIHDRGLCLYHPLIGVSEVHASTASASLGVQIQDTGSAFFGNKALPSGILTAPGRISTDTADALKLTWETKFQGGAAGKIAVLGDDLKFTPMTMTAADAQQTEQLRWSIEDVARCFNVPLHKLNSGAPPTFNNISALNQDYYQQVLQTLIESMETLLDDALGYDATSGVEFDIDSLLRMDPQGRATVAKEYVGAGIWSPNEARAADGKLPVRGGESPVMQQQNYSLESLASRPNLGDVPEPAPASEQPEEENPPIEEQAKALIRRIKRKAAALEGQSV